MIRLRSQTKSALRRSFEIQRAMRAVKLHKRQKTRDKTSHLIITSKPNTTEEKME